MRSNILVLDTSNNKEVKVGLKINDEKFLIEQAIDHRKAQAVLPIVEQLLKEHNLRVADITSIEVNPGPGSFTGVRVGVTIANALGFLLNIPVNEKEFVEPIYS